MRSTKRITGVGIVLAAWVLVLGAAAPAQGQQRPDSVYDVATDYGWTMSSRESSGYYTFNSPLRMNLRLSFIELGGGRLRMRLDFAEVSYTDQNRSWRITDFSDLGTIHRRLVEHCRRGASLRHFTELAAFEEEALGYLMALSDGLTVVIDPLDDTAATFSNLREQHNMLWAGSRPAGRSRAGHEGTSTVGPKALKVQAALSEVRRLGQLASSSRRGMSRTARVQYNRAVAELRQAHLAHSRAVQEQRSRRKALKSRTPRSAPGSLVPLANNRMFHMLRQNPRLGMLWAQQIRTLAMFAQRPEYNTLAPANSVPQSQPAFSLSGLYRWLPAPEDLFRRLDGGPSRNLNTLGLRNLRQSDAWLLGTDKTTHTVEEALNETPSGRLQYRRMKVESRLNSVDAFAMLPNTMGIRGTVEVQATTTLEAMLVDPETSASARTILEERGAAAAQKKDYVQAVALHEEYLRVHRGAPRTERVRQRLRELRLNPAARALLAAARARRRSKSWTKLAESALRNGKPEIARKWLTNVVRSYPETTWAARARKRLSQMGHPAIAVRSELQPATFLARR